ncbi:MAG: PD-(D/E)XK nuclease family protein [Bacteroidales bacterium]|nr:PD-(D/E)XK nuclease family protein [Bacteroidales bacterium]
MPAFLETLSKTIYTDNIDRLGDICIVLPNRRAALFIKKYLGRIIRNTSFLPTFFSIEDFVTHSTGMQIADGVALQFGLYDIHKLLEKENVRPIDEFLPYAAWMLSDFNDIDMYLVDPAEVFSSLSDAKAIAMWNPDGSPLSDMEQRFLKFFRSLADYYHELNETLKAEGRAYQGMAFRSMADQIDSIAEQLAWKEVIFAGFNALTAAEEKIIKHLLNTRQAKIYWDADRYYAKNKAQEAGQFLQKYFNTLSKGEPLWVEDNFSKPKDIEIIGVAKNAGQVKYAGEIIKKITGRGEALDNTALVLPDEELLLPLLNSIPEEAGPFNVTMGLPLNSTPLFTLLDNILGMHQNADRYQEIKDPDERTYFVRDLIRIFNHPWIHLFEDEEKGMQLTARLRNSNKIFLRASELPVFLEGGPEWIIGDKGFFPAKVNLASLLETFIYLLHALRAVFIEKRNKKEHDQAIELEYIFRFNTLIKKLQGLIRKYGAISTVKTLHLIFRQLAAMQRIPFYGEPLQGLQVMGMLETRTLDFDTLIILSMNEGILPASRSANSFIPYDIKNHFNLPTYKDNNAVFAYHFYRLIQRARKVYLLYNTEAGQLGGEEKSRFINQLLYEAKMFNPDISIKETLLSPPPLTERRDTKITIEKNAGVMELLVEEARKGLHPSSLALYISCPLQFYLSRLIRIKEIDEPDETIDSRILGIVIHESLNKLLKPYLNKPLSVNIFKEIGKQVSAEVHRQFSLAMHDGDLSTGKNHLILNVAVNMLLRFISKEISWLNDGEDLYIKMLEETLSSSIGIRVKNIPLDVKIKGTIDRIDVKGRQLRILDYKTGYVNQRQLSPVSCENLRSDPEYGKAFQLLIYAWLYNKNIGASADMQAGIISLRMPGEGPVKLRPPDNKNLNAATLSEFEQELSALLMEIFDRDIPFSQTTDEKNCKFCNFREICNKIITKDNY